MFYFLIVPASVSVKIRDQSTELSPQETQKPSQEELKEEKTELPASQEPPHKELEKEKTELSAPISEKENKISDPEVHDDSEEEGFEVEDEFDFLKGVRESDLVGGAMEEVVEQGHTSEAGLGWDANSDSMSSGSVVNSDDDEVIFKKKKFEPFSFRF